jgi:hypothetical protein
LTDRIGLTAFDMGDRLRAVATRGCFRSGAVESDLTNGDRAVRQMDDLGFSADWWASYRGLIAQRQVGAIGVHILGDRLQIDLSTQLGLVVLGKHY